MLGPAAIGGNLHYIGSEMRFCCPPIVRYPARRVVAAGVAQSMATTTGTPVPRGSDVRYLGFGHFSTRIASGGRHQHLRLGFSAPTVPFRIDAVFQFVREP